jgi:hypothetical protein
MFIRNLWFYFDLSADSLKIGAGFLLSSFEGLMLVFTFYDISQLKNMFEAFFPSVTRHCHRRRQRIWKRVWIKPT